MTFVNIEIKNYISKRNINTKERDVIREQWFLENNMKLVRIIEKDFKDKKYDQILSHIHGAVNV